MPAEESSSTALLAKTHGFANNPNQVLTNLSIVMNTHFL